jgi:hypothetical protein
VTGPESDEARLAAAAAAADDELAARLLAAHRFLSTLDVDQDVRIGLHLRFMAICSSLKVPEANRVRGAERLDRLLADAERARGNIPGGFG